MRARPSVVLAALFAIGCRETKDESTGAPPTPAPPKPTLAPCASALRDEVTPCAGELEKATERTFVWTSAASRRAAIVVTSRSQAGFVVIVDDDAGGTLENALATPQLAARIELSAEASHPYTIHVSPTGTGPFSFTLGIEPGDAPVVSAPPLPDVSVEVVSVKAKDALGEKELLRSQAWRFRGCYQRALAADHASRGKLTLTIEVVEGGEARAAKALPESWPEAMRACVESAAASITYPDPTAGYEKIEATLSFAPK